MTTWEEALLQVTDAVTEAEAAAAAAILDRNRVMLDVYRDGASARAISLITGLTEGRVFQILRAGKDAVPGTFDGSPALFQGVEDGEFQSAVVLHEHDGGYKIEDQ